MGQLAHTYIGGPIAEGPGLSEGLESETDASRPRWTGVGKERRTVAKRTRPPADPPSRRWLLLCLVLLAALAGPESAAGKEFKVPTGSTNEEVRLVGTWVSQEPDEEAEQLTWQGTGEAPSWSRKPQAWSVSLEASGRHNSNLSSKNATTRDRVFSFGSEFNFQRDGDQHMIDFDVYGFTLNVDRALVSTEVGGDGSLAGEVRVAAGLGFGWAKVDLKSKNTTTGLTTKCESWNPLVAGNVIFGYQNENLPDTYFRLQFDVDYLPQVTNPCEIPLQFGASSNTSEAKTESLITELTFAVTRKLDFTLGELSNFNLGAGYKLQCGWQDVTITNTEFFLPGDFQISEDMYDSSWGRHLGTLTAGVNFRRVYVDVEGMWDGDDSSGFNVRITHPF